jgi:hypothetical protein
MPTDDEIREILRDPSLSDWLRTAMLSALDRDPMDAANDAGLLALVLDRRVRLAVEQDTTITDILDKLVAKELG